MQCGYNAKYYTFLRMAALRCGKPVRLAGVSLSMDGRWVNIHQRCLDGRSEVLCRQ